MPARSMVVPRLRAARLALEMTQHALALAARISARTVARAEAGKPIREQHADQLRAALTSAETRRRLDGDDDYPGPRRGPRA